ncbi:hypothetical protein D3C87_1243070 [compost metagenome]
MDNIESIILQKKEPSYTRCSRLFFAEHDAVSREDGELVYSVYSTLQHRTINLELREQPGVQRFAVLWDREGVDNRVFETIERAIIKQVLSPVSIIHYTKGCLAIVLNQDHDIKNLQEFIDTWQDIAGYAIWEDWTLSCFESRDLTHLMEGRILREYAKNILSAEDLGIVDYNYNMFLYKESWSQEPITDSQQPGANWSQEKLSFSDNPGEDDENPF